MGWTTRTVKCYWRLLTALLTPVLLLPLPAIAGDRSEARCGYVILVMIILWLTEAVPLPATALIPVFAYPFLGILSTEDVCLNYFVDPIMLFVGGLLFAVSMDCSGLNKRFAYFILLQIGISPGLLMAGFMTTTMLLSMWINNTAATALVLPTLEAILDELELQWKPPPRKVAPILIIPKITITDIEEDKETPWGETNQGFDDDISNGDVKTSPSTALTIDEIDEVNKKDYSIENLRRSLYLSVAYSANIGGTGFMTGTPANLVLMGLLDKEYSETTDVNFISWMAFTIPLMLICIIGGWALLQYLYFGFKGHKRLAAKEKQKKEIMRRIIRSKYETMGKISFHEGIVAAFFVLLLLFWIFREPGYIRGWEAALESLYVGNTHVTDASIFILLVFLLFVIPANLPEMFESSSTDPVPWRGCLSWKEVQNKIPWGVVILIGGGYAMAEGAKASKLTAWLGYHFSAVYSAPLPIVVFFATFITMCLTNIAPNVATANLLLPIFNEMSLATCSNPLHLLVPATITCSYAFILPASTTANAIVYFSSDRLNQSDMIKAGIGMNLICIFMVNVLINTLGFSVFELGHLPPWINSTVHTPLNESCFY